MEYKVFFFVFESSPLVLKVQNIVDEKGIIYFITKKKKKTKNKKTKQNKKQIFPSNNHSFVNISL
jgi:hypothetical protein